MERCKIKSKIKGDNFLTAGRLCTKWGITVYVVCLCACLNIIVKTEFNTNTLNIPLPGHVETNTENNVTALSYDKIVLIVAYMRTGSTLTGRILQSYPGTFYIFEPLHLLASAFLDMKRDNETSVMLQFVNGTKRNFTMSDRSKVMLDEIQSWLNCKIESVSVLGLTNRFHAWFSNIMGAFTFCSQGHLSSNINMNDPKLIMCLKTAIKDCQKAPLKALKLLRLPMNDVIKLLPIYPNMKIIHLLRDPRGIMNSRFNVGEVTEANFQEILEEHCAEVENNLKFSKTILNKYSNRLKIIIYEDLAERPLETARSLVKFAGLLFNKSMQKFILNQTHAPCDDDTYSTQRKSSTETAYKWRTQMDPEKAKFIYNMCKESNRILGYLPLASVQALRNLTIPSRQKLNVAKELFKNKF